MKGPRASDFPDDQWLDPAEPQAQTPGTPPPASALAGPDPWAAWLSARDRQALDLPTYRRAAVLVALTRAPDPQVILTVRSSDLPTHRGQIAFPGGSLEGAETPVEGALREAWEEIGLPPGKVTVLGELDDVFTPVGFHVTPVLARVPAPVREELHLSGEVARIITPTLGELRARPPQRETRRLPDGTRQTVYRYPWQGFDIWGMTARVLYDLIESGL